MFVLEQVLRGVILPAGIAGFLLLIALRPWAKERRPTRDARWTPPLAVGLAYFGAHLAVAAPPGFVPADDLDWLLHMALLAACLGAVESFIYEKTALRWAMRIGAVLLTFWLTLGFMVEIYWSAGVAVAWMTALTLATCAVIATLDQTAEIHPGASVPLVMVVLGSGACIVLVLTGNARVGQLMGGLTAAAGAILLLALRRSKLRVSRGGCTVFGLLFGGLLAFGYASSADIPALAIFWTHTQTVATLLVAAAPLMLWASRQIRVERLSAPKAALARALLVALPLAGAVAIAANPPKEPTTEHELGGTGAMSHPEVGRHTGGLAAKIPAKPPDRGAGHPDLPISRAFSRGSSLGVHPPGQKSPRRRPIEVPATPIRPFLRHFSTMATPRRGHGSCLIRAQETRQPEPGWSQSRFAELLS
jgi:hypothetical protein